MMELPKEMNHKIEKVSVLQVEDGDVVIIKISKDWRKSPVKLQNVSNFFRALFKRRKISFGFDLGAIEGIKIIRGEDEGVRKEDEIDMMRFLVEAEASKGRTSSLLLNYVSDSKRKHYILKKWTEKRWWDYGVSMRSGWPTDEGMEAIKEVLKGEDEGEKGEVKNETRK